MDTDNLYVYAQHIEFLSHTDKHADVVLVWKDISCFFTTKEITEHLYFWRAIVLSFIYWHTSLYLCLRMLLRYLEW